MAKTKTKKPPKFHTDLATHVANHQGRLEPGATSPLCIKCRLDAEGARNPYIRPDGPRDPLITIVTEGISKQEDEDDRPGTGGTGGLMASLIKKFAADIGISVEDVRWVPLTRCCARNKIPNYKTKGNWCRWHLVEDLMLHPPKLILAVGTTALGALCHKSSAQDWGGRLLTYRGWPDDWITDKFKDGHPVFGAPPGPDKRIPLFPVQAPRLVYATQNPHVVKRWRDQVQRGLALAVNGVEVPVYDRKWWQLTDDPSVIVDKLTSIPDGADVNFDTETNGLYPYKDGSKIVLMMFRWTKPDGTPDSIGFPWNYEASPILQHIEWLAPIVLETMYRTRVFGHNLGFDILFVHGTVPGANLEKLTSAMAADLWHMLYTLKQERGSLGLELVAYDWAESLAGYEEEMVLLIEQLEILQPDKGGHYANCPKDKWDTHLRPYIMGDVEVLAEAVPRVRERLESAKQYRIPLSHPTQRSKFRYYSPPGRAWVYDQLMTKSMRVLTRMMGRGMYVNEEELIRQEDIFPKTIVAIKDKLKNVDERIVDWCNSQTAQDPKWEFDLEKAEILKTVLFDILKLPIKRLTPAGTKKYGENPEGLSYEEMREFAAADKFTLNLLAAETAKVRPLLEYRKAHKAYSTYIRPMRNIFTKGIDKKDRAKEQYLMRDHCVHPNFNQCGTRGGRLSSCVSGDTLIDLSTGSIAIENFASLNLETAYARTHNNRYRRVNRVFFKGRQPAFQVSLSCGSRIVVTALHSFLTPDGWKYLGELCERSVIYSCGHGRAFQEKSLVRSVVCEAVSGRTADGLRLNRTLWQTSSGINQNLLAVDASAIQQYVPVFARKENSGTHAWKYARSKAPIQAVQKGRNRVFARDGSLAVCDGQASWNNGLRHRQEHRLLLVDSASQQVLATLDSNGRCTVLGTREDMAWYSVCCPRVSVAQERVRDGSLRCILQAAGIRRVCERVCTTGLVGGTLGEPRAEVDLVVIEQVRAGASQLHDGSWNTVYPPAFDWDIIHRFRDSGDEPSRGSGRQLPHARKGPDPRQLLNESRIQNPSLYNRPRASTNPIRDGINFERDQIVQIEFAGYLDIWDLEVAGDHSYTAQGFVNHNSNPNAQNLPRDSSVKRVYTSRFGKCVAQGQRVWTARGLIKIEDVVVGDSVTQEDGSWRRVLAVHDQGAKHTVTLTTECGYSFTATPDHKIRVVDKSGNYVWRRIRSLKPDDYVAVQPGYGNRSTTAAVSAMPIASHHLHKPIKNQDKTSQELCFFLGYLLGDGSQSRYTTSYAVCDLDQDLKGYLDRTFKSLFGYVPRETQYPGATRHDFNSVLLSQWLKDIGQDKKTQTFPEFIWTAAPELQAAFIRGLFESDGSSGKKHRDQDNGQFRFIFGTSCEAGMRGVTELMLSLGIHAGVTYSRNTQSWRVYVHADSVKSFCDRVGFVSLRKTRSAERYAAGIGPGKKFGLPHQSSLVKSEKLSGDAFRLTRNIRARPSTVTSALARKLVAHVPDGPLKSRLVRFTKTGQKFERVLSVVAAGKIRTFDLTVDETQTFIVNGIVSHNSGCIYQGDLSQIELRLLAAACGDPNMVTAYHKGIDIHSLTTSLIFKIPYEHFSKDYMSWLQKEGRDKEAKDLDLKRKIGKQTNFLTGYGGGPLGLQNSLAEASVFMSFDECDLIVETFFDNYACLRRHISLYKDFILNNGVAVSIFGRVRVFQEVFGEDKRATSKALRSGYNHLIQSTASDMMLLCLAVIEHLMREAGLQSVLMSTVHDSLVIDALISELDQVHAICKSVLKNIPEVLRLVFGDDYDDSWIIVPLDADFEVGRNYLDCRRVTEPPDWDKLLAADEH